MSNEPLPLFPNYIQLRTRSRVPLRAWDWLRAVGLLAAGLIVTALLVAPSLGLLIFWGLLVPVLPLLFLLAPGLWRNVCPLATLNQLPRRLGLSRAWNAPPWLKTYAYVIGFSAFLLLASSRKWLFNTNGPATAVLILALLVAAFLGGMLLKGKSGWCSSLCPLLPVQRLYNQTPFVAVANSHCDPCVGCTKNCYDFNPSVAYLVDLYDEDRYYSGYRKFFAAAMPGFIVGYFTVPNPPAISVGLMYAGLAAAVAISVGAFFTLDTFVKVSPNKLTALAAVAALNLFYWFGLPAWLATLGGLLGATPAPWVVWAGRAALLALTAVWLARTYAKEPLVLARLAGGEATRLAPQATSALQAAVRADKVEVSFHPGAVRVLADTGRTLLEIAERNSQPIEAGCRMGMCGADPVVILAGAEHLSAPGDEERATLERLGLGGAARLACMCRVKGPVSVSFELEQARGEALAGAAEVTADPAIRSVVIIGNGIAGVTAADYVRRRHRDCEIHLIGQERHPLYNRMAITRLVYGRSAMNGLYLQPDSWYDERRITCWLNTQAVQIDREQRQVVLATGDTLPYDRLILATGSASLVPSIAGFGLPGSFVLREAEDAMELRAFVQTHRSRRAAVGGGGLLGLEAAYALRKLGLHVTVLERGPWLLRRQLDERGALILRRYLEGLGIEVLLQAETAAVNGASRVEEVVLHDGRRLTADILLVAVGITPNVALARAAGLEVGRGVKVSTTMATGEPDIFAAGDVAEAEGQVLGLWPVAVEQARVAAHNATGGQESYREVVPVTTLKVAGIDLTSIGRVEPRGPDELVVALEEEAGFSYRKLVIANGAIVGAILIGHAQDAAAVTAAVKAGRDVSGMLEALQAGRWEDL